MAIGVIVMNLEGEITMAEIWADVLICRPWHTDVYKAQSIVDVWADHSVFPESVLNEIGITPICTRAVELPDGSQANWGYGVVWLAMGDQRMPCPVLFSPHDDWRLGASALQIFNLEEDYTAKALVPTGPLSVGRASNVGGENSPCEFAIPTSVAPLEGHRIWLRYADGVSGEVDLSDMSHTEPFVQWNDREFFKTVRLGAGGSIEWSNDVTLCGDALYLKLADKVAQK
jgi:hypothetical protein